jgi:hypothetical protein
MLSLQNHVKLSGKKRCPVMMLQMNRNMTLHQTGVKLRPLWWIRINLQLDRQNLCLMWLDTQLMGEPTKANKCAVNHMLLVRFCLYSIGLSGQNTVDRRQISAQIVLKGLPFQCEIQIYGKTMQSFLAPIT